MALLALLAAGCNPVDPPPEPAPGANAYVCSCSCPSGLFTREVVDFPVCMPPGRARYTRDEIAGHCADVVCPALTIAVHELGDQCLLDCRVGKTRRDGTPVWEGISDVQQHLACETGCRAVDCDLAVGPQGNVTGNWLECTRIACDVENCTEQSGNICRPPVEDFLDTGFPSARGG